MAANSLSAASDGRVSITVPAEYADRFRTETLSAFAIAAEAIQEVCDWTRKDTERGRPARVQIDARDLERLHEAERIFVQGREREGELTIEAKVRTLYSAAQGCMLDTADTLKDEAEKLKGDVRAAVAEFGFWHTLVEQFDGENPEAGR